MNKPTHTAGPWTVHQLSNGHTWVQAGPETDICSVSIPYPFPGAKPDDGIIQTANAKLIAAAPDLLKALMDLCANADKPVICLQDAHAAIAKATQP